MNTRYLTSSDNIKSVLATANTYFVVEEDITLTATQYSLGQGSVIDFSGGCFKGIVGSKLNLNGGQIIAGHHPVFLGVEVTGFSNSQVLAEWFKADKDAAHTYINKALAAAGECPVVLDNKNYQLTDTIVLPQSATLICPGTITLDASTKVNGPDPIAFDISKNNTRLEVNKIEGIMITNPTSVSVDSNGVTTEETVYTGDNYQGTGIRISGEAVNVDIKIHYLINLYRGIEIMPGREGKSSSVQYLNIDFQRIQADTGIYIDIYAHGNALDNWFSRSVITGGRLRGYNGIIMADSETDFDTNHISGIIFKNIGFERLNGMPLRLRNASQLRFDFIRMAESLPETGAWIDIKEVAMSEISIIGNIRIDKYAVSGRCDNIVVKGHFMQDKGDTDTPLDTLVIDSVLGQDNKRINAMGATRFVKPYNMTDTVTRRAI